MKKSYLIILAILLGVLGALYLRENPPPSNMNLRVGVTSGPHAIILEHVKEKAKKQGLGLDIVQFDDFILPNAALSQGDINVNCYQHKPFLIEQVKSRGYKIHSIANTVLMPMGIYSNKIKSINELKDGSKIGIPNDPTNGGRALLLLQRAGLLNLTDNQNPSLLDIKENPKKLQIIELDAPRLPRSLEDLDIAVVNTDFIVLAKMDPSTAILKETTDSPYTNVLVVRDGDEDKPEIKQFVALYQTEDTKKFIEDTFKGAVISGW
jgi:D-methionine transport system substrate-binding protein